MSKNEENHEIKSDADGVKADASKKKAADANSKKKKQIIQSCIIAGVIVVILIVVMLLINPISKKIEGEISEDVPLGFTTYNASRYFFRFDYKEGWFVKTDTGEHGFMQNDKTGLVVSLFPVLSDGTAGNDDAEQGVDSVVTNYNEDFFADFYYREISSDKSMSSKEAFDAFRSTINAELLTKDDKVISDIKIGGGSVYAGRNEEFYCGDVEYTATDAEGNEELFRGKVYVSARSMAYCAIVLCCNADEGALYSQCEDSFKTTIDSFRFSVFDD